MRKMCQNSAQSCVDGQFATNVPLNFQIKTFKSLIEAVAKAEDAKNFNLDMSREKGFDWDAYEKTYILGVRQHILKDNISTLSHAKQKLRRIYWITKTMQLISVSTLIGLAIW